MGCCVSIKRGEEEAQYKADSEVGHAGHLREAYHGEPANLR